jgi:hypothetical protein
MPRRKRHKAEPTYTPDRDEVLLLAWRWCRQMADLALRNARTGSIPIREYEIYRRADQRLRELQRVVGQDQLEALFQKAYMDLEAR